MTAFTARRWAGTLHFDWFSGCRVPHISSKRNAHYNQRRLVKNAGISLYARGQIDR